METETLTPREAVRVVPYAATLRPRARIGGTDAGDGSLHLYNSSNRQTINLNGSAGAIYLGANSQDGDIAVYNSAGSTTLSVDGDTDIVTQVRTGYGAVKAAVYAYCAGSGATVHRSFPTGVTISGGGLAGLCTLVFPFRVDDRYYTATAHGSVAGDLVSSMYTGTNIHLHCRCFNNAGGATDGDIMVVIY